MPECSFHPGVETNVRCADCDRYICPKDMVDTPVGYKCRECGLVGKPKLGGVKPGQLLRGVLFGVVAALLVAPFARMIHFFFIGTLVYGALVGEATRRGGGGHRTPEFAGIAAGAAALGAVVAGFFGGFDIYMILGGPVIAAIYVLSWRWFG